MSITLGRRRLSLRHKLIVLPVVAVTLALLAAGVALVAVIDRLYVDLSRQSLEGAAQTLRQGLDESGRRLSGDARMLAGRSELVAVASMVDSYQDIDHYQPLVFDLEKQRIASRLASRLSLSGHDRVAMCDVRGELIAAALRDRGRITLYAQSYEAGEPRLLEQSQEGGWQKSAGWPDTLSLCNHQSGLFLKGTPEGVVLQATEPVVRILPDERRRVVGRVSLSALQTPADLLLAQEGVAMALIADQRAYASTFSQPLSGSLIQRLAQAEPTEWIKGEHYYLRPLLLEKGSGLVQVALGLNNTLYQEQRRQAMWVLLGVLLLSALVVIPVSAWLANRSVLRPVEQLAANMESIKAGSYQNLKPDESDDEIGRLSRAFDTMAQAVWQREWELQEYRDHLEQKVEKEVERRQDQEKILIRQSRLAAMGEALSSIAHHWRQPLNALGANIQDLPDAYAHGELSDTYLKKVSGDSMRLINQMSQTIDAFRNFFRPDTHKEPFSVVHAIERTLKMLSPTLENSRVSVSTDFRADPVVEGYPSEFSQVILHLMSNAVDAMLERQSKVRNIRIRVEATDEGRARIELCDSGGGIEEPLVARLFEPYVSTKQKSHGSGVGLYMAKMIVEWNMHGSITFANREGGACFTIVI